MRNIFATLLLSLALFVSPAGADKPLGVEEFNSIDEFAYAIAAFFPKVQGEVTAVQGDQMTIALGKKHGLMAGMVLSVWRDGREILHPVTKAVIGRAENEVGTVEVTDVQEKTSTAVMKKRLLEPKEGDRARITPKKIGLGILPLRDDKPEIVSGLTERLGELGRFTLPPKDKVAAFLKDHKQRDASLVKEMGSAFALDAVVVMSIHPTEGKFLVNCKLYAADDGKQMETITAMLNLASKREALGEVRPFFAPVKEVSGRIPDVPVEARYFAVADLDGDGAAEHLFSDEERLTVYRAEKGGWKEVWKESIPARERGMRQFHVDTADINGNGRPEIFVTRMLDGKVSSYVMEFQDGAFNRIADIPGFLRVVRYPGRGAVLIGQDYEPENFFAGQPREYGWNGNAYAAGAAFNLPKGTDLYNFVFADFGEGRQMLVSLDSDNRLVVYSGESRIWKSEEEYHPLATVLMKPRTGLDAIGSSLSDERASQSPAPPLGDKSRQVRIKGRFIAVDLYGSSTDVLVIPKNSRSSLAGTDKGGELEVLAWTGTRLEPRWNTKDLAGPVFDVQVSRSEAGGMQIAALVKVSSSFFGKGTFRVETYEGK